MKERLQEDTYGDETQRDHQTRRYRNFELRQIDEDQGDMKESNAITRPFGGWR